MRVNKNELDMVNCLFIAFVATVLFLLVAFNVWLCETPNELVHQFFPSTGRMHPLVPLRLALFEIVLCEILRRRLSRSIHHKSLYALAKFFLIVLIIVLCAYNFRVFNTILYVS